MFNSSIAIHHATIQVSASQPQRTVGAAKQTAHTRHVTMWQLVMSSWSDD
jgi:hypothetical protein